MSIKLVLLKSGEDIISDLTEMVVGEGENRVVVGYFFTKPCVVKMRTTEESKDKSYQISLFPWLPLSKDTKVPVINDWVITIVEPIDTLREMYENDVLKKKNDQTASAAEQSDLVISN